MKFALLIHEDEAFWDREPNADWGPVLEQYRAFGENNGAVIEGGAALTASRHTTTVRADGDERILTDGPYAETREQFGGFYVVEAESLEKAVELAKQIPFASTGGVEIRPVMDFSQVMA